MAVPAHYPPNLLLHSRDETEMDSKEMDANFSPPLLEQSRVLFSSSNGEVVKGAGNGNRRKRGREDSTFATPPQQQQQQIIFSYQSPAMLDHSQTPPYVSTGLHLALIDQNNSQITREQQPDSLISSSFSEDLTAQINKQNNEIDRYLITQGEHLRRALADKQQRQYRFLLESAGKKLLDKDAEIERASHFISELEHRLSRLHNESMQWKVKAMAEQAAAASLLAQLKKAAADTAAAAPPRGEENSGESPAEDAESAHVDPNRPGKIRPCRACLSRPAMVVLLPCCHLCLCVSCDFVTVVGDACPVCGCFRTGSIHVSFA